MVTVNVGAWLFAEGVSLAIDAMIEVAEKPATPNDEATIGDAAIKETRPGRLKQHD